MSSPDVSDDEDAIDTLVAAFYAAFDNRSGRAVPADALRDMFLEAALITRATTDGIDTMSVDRFIAPRERMLSDGTLTDFHEWETEARTLVLRDIAARRSTYAKRGDRDGALYEGVGSKLIQFVRTGQGWRIAAICWEDD